jgi:hypothetical protein
MLQRISDMPEGTIGFEAIGEVALESRAIPRSSVGVGVAAIAA